MAASYFKSTKNIFEASVHLCFSTIEKPSMVCSDKTFRDSPRSVSNVFSYEIVSTRFHRKAAHPNLAADISLLTTTTTPSKQASQCLTKDNSITAERIFCLASTHRSRAFSACEINSATAYFTAKPSFFKPLETTTFASTLSITSRSAVTSSQMVIISSTIPAIVRSSRSFASTSSVRFPIALARKAFWPWWSYRLRCSSSRLESHYKPSKSRYEFLLTSSSFISLHQILFHSPSFCYPDLVKVIFSL